MKLHYSDNRQAIKTLYDESGYKSDFKRDDAYLENAFKEINEIWFKNFNDIKTINYLLIAEAPLWGDKKKYIYNPHTNNTQFFYRSDIGKLLDIQIKDKKEFIKICNDIGLLMLDISPFPLNPKDTKINYRENINDSKRLTPKEYKELVRRTLPTFFNQKVELVSQKKSSDIKVFFRYARVKNAFQDLISDLLIQNGLVKHINDIGDIAQSGGGIDRVKLKNILFDG